MKIIAILVIISVLSLTGCTQLGKLLGDGSDRLLGDWNQDGDPEYKIRLQEDGSGIALNKNTNDYIFTWRLDPDDSEVMYWEIDGQSTRVVRYYLLQEDTILVLEWNGKPTVYERE